MQNAGTIEIAAYTDSCLEDIIDLILGIQQNEFGIPVKLEDQPDLKTIPKTYQSGKGNFWVALYQRRVIGTVGLIDIGNNMGVIRKMFVNAAFRGRDNGVSQRLMQTLTHWAREKGITQIYLGTVEILAASHRFYEKNGFVRIQKENLPAEFPAMKVDTIFYMLQLNDKTI